MFNLHVPASLASLPGRRHVCEDDNEGIERAGKVCGFCHEWKGEDSYSITTRGYLRSYCKACMSKKSTAWNQANKERVKANKAARRAKGEV